MNLITFSHFTAGTMLFGMLQDYNVKIRPSRGEYIATVNKVGTDSNSFSTDLSSKEIYDQAIVQDSSAEWSYTHSCLVGQDLSMFGIVLNITTETFKSRYYRWLRVCQQYYKSTEIWKKQTTETRRDKMRETAKNYLAAYPYLDAPNVINLEFSDIVEETPEFRHVMEKLGAKQQLHLLEQWKVHNQFLYNDDIWKIVEFEVFTEAEYEQKLNKYYRYE